LVLATQKLGGITGWGTRRAGAFALLAILLGAYYAFVAHLTDLSTRWELTFLALCLMPAVFGLVWFALPYWPTSRSSG
jgi:hypothetical protein